jgi:tagatose 6-phosphate kinase
VILTVTLNAALDVTYDVDALVAPGTNRVRSVVQRAGGKGVNVARTLHALGHDVVLTGFAGAEVRAELRTAGLHDEFVDTPGRRTITVVDGVDATVLCEPGPVISAEQWAFLIEQVRSLAVDASAVVLSGSLPPGVPEDAYAQLGRAAGDHPVLLDTSGPALLAGLAATPAVVKPNRDELAELGASPESLLAGGAGAVVVSCGAEGLTAVTGAGTWRARPPEVVTGNPTGAGDAVVAALAATVAEQWPERLRDAVALSAATVLAPVAGEFDRAAYERFRPAVTVEEI